MTFSKIALGGISLNIYLDTQTISIIFILVSALLILLLILVIGLIIKIKRIEKSYIIMQAFKSKTNLEEILKSNQTEIKEAKQKLQVQDAKIKKIEDKVRSAIDSISLIKFNSFANLGGELSFAMALLNQEGTGVLLT